MDCVWELNTAVSVRDVLDVLQRGRQIAYTTVMTVMENLHRKGMLQRELHGRAYRYRHVHSREQHTTQMIGQVLASSRDRTATLLHFVDQMDPEEVARLREALTNPDHDAGRRGTSSSPATSSFPATSSRPSQD